jgi:hypothetical protein
VDAWLDWSPWLRMSSRMEYPSGLGLLADQCPDEQVAKFLAGDRNLSRGVDANAYAVAS